MITLSELVFPTTPAVADCSFKRVAEDFVVEEIMEHQPCGEGEHLWLWVEKRGSNTDWVANQLADFYGLRRRDVCWSGRKDRHAVTRQWFSVGFPIKKEIELPPENAEYAVLRHVRHQKKIRIGIHQGNQFSLKVYCPAASQTAIEASLNYLRDYPMVNYVGEQRFGRDQSNLQGFVDWFRGEQKPQKHQRSLWLSAFRSAVFNQLASQLAGRCDIAQGSFELSPEQWFSFANGRSLFQVADADEVKNRLAQREIVPAVWLPGVDQGRQAANADELAIMQSVLGLQGEDDLTALQKFMRQLALESGRRPLWVSAENLCWSWSAGESTDELALQLDFALPTGSYATTLLQHLANNWRGQDDSTGE